MNFIWISCFLETAKQAGFTKAAQKLHLSQQTVSKYVMNLEEYLGVELIDREQTPIQLTSAGKYYSSLFTATEQKLRCLSETMSNPEYSGISVGLSEYLDPLGAVTQAIRDFAAEYPSVKLEIVSLSNEELSEKLQESGLDVVIISANQLTQLYGVEAEPIAAEHLCLGGPPDVVGTKLNPEARERRANLAYLIKEGRRSSFEIAAFCRQEMESMENAPGKTVVLPNIATLKDELEHNGGLAVFDSKFGFTGADRGIGVEPLNVESDLCCCYLSSNDNPAVPGIVKWLKRRL